MPESVTGGSTQRRALIATTAALALAFGVAACGDDEEESAGEATTEEVAASAEEVTVTADEYSFDLSATPSAETKSVTFDNQGKEFHVMIFARLNEGFTLDEAVELEGKKGSAVTLAEAEAPPGKSTTVDIEDPIEPGSYVMLCPISGKDGPHYKLGQLQEFDIE